MKNLFALLLFVFSAFVSQAQIDNPNAPIMKFVTETHDFGTIKDGTVVSYDFEFTNVGKEPLIIQNCTAMCGCTTPDWTKAPILPGQKGKISVKFDSAGKSGPQNKTVFITSNAKSDKKKYEIYIKGNVVPK